MTDEQKYLTGFLMRTMMIVVMAYLLFQEIGYEH